VGLRSRHPALHGRQRGRHRQVRLLARGVPLDVHRGHPAGRGRGAPAQCRQQPPQSPGYGYSGEWQHLRKDGTRFWVEVTGHTLLRDGRPARLVLAQDITDRRQAEERSRLISQVFEATEEGIFITDAQNRFVSINRAFSRITGYSPEEVLGQTPALLKSGRQNRTFYAELWKQLNTEGRWEGEIWNRNKAGEVYPEWLAINAIKDERGQLQQYLGIFTETSSRKSAEERILRLANHDSLTDLPNRALLADRARVVLATARHQHRRWC
jgi:PAS domain S-box-containing protein